MRMMEMMMETMVTMLMMMETVEQSSRQISVARATRLMSNIASSVASPYSRNLKIIFVIKTAFSALTGNPVTRVSDMGGGRVDLIL